MAARYGEQLVEARDAAAAAVEALDAEKAAVAVANAATTAACDREALLKQALHDSEERSTTVTSHLGASSAASATWA